MDWRGEVRRGNEGPSGAKALEMTEGFIAALKALRHQKSLQNRDVPERYRSLERARQPKLFC